MTSPAYQGVAPAPPSAHAVASKTAEFHPVPVNGLAVHAPPMVPLTDPIDLVDRDFLRHRAATVLDVLVRSLSPGDAEKVADLPLVFDDTVGEVNAFAACTESRRALLAVTDGLLEIVAMLAIAQATDERFGTNRVDEFSVWIARHQRPGNPILRPPASFWPKGAPGDRERIARQHLLFDETLAFVLGHELAHHYLGHLPCTTNDVVGHHAAAAGHVISHRVPLLNQPGELAADVSGTRHVLTAGRSQSPAWSEEGGVLAMRFFARMRESTALEVLFSFQRSHPPALVRRPVIERTAAAFRAVDSLRPNP